MIFARLPKIWFLLLLATFSPLSRAWCAPIEWQSKTLQLIQSGGNYARIARVDAQSIACIYERGGGIRIKRSADNGKTWGDEIKVADLDGYGAANPELLVLPGGDWLCSFNPRPRRNTGLPFTIAVCRSTDNGSTWSAPDTVYRAGTNGGVGCWEPRAICAPDGSVQLYFANEFPFPDNADQEITRLVSRDNGHTWGAAQTVNYRAGARDGMPAPIVLQSGQIVMAIEDNGLNGAFKPVIIAPQTGDYVDGASPNRWSALQSPLDKTAYAGAPYLCQMADGTTILSAQLAPDGNLNRARMAVWTGDKNARDFADLSFPFAAFGAPNGLWNALWTKDSRTVSALSSAKIGDIFGVWCVDGKVGAPAN